MPRGILWIAFTGTVIRGIFLDSVTIAFIITIATNLAAGDELINFNSEIRPVLSNKCFQCHGPNEEDRKEDLRLDVPDGEYGALKPRKGYFIVKPGQPEDSELWYRIATDVANDRMPPKRSHKEPLT